MTATVTVIIPCYNGDRYLAEAIESVLAQTYPATEIIVVDNASTDGSKAIAMRYPSVKYMYLYPNQGAAGARNQAIAASTGEYIVMVDCDDRLLPKAIEVGVNQLEAHPDWMFAFGTCRLIDEHGLPAKFGRKVLEQPVHGSVYQTLLRGTCLNPFGRHIFRRALFEAIGTLDRSLRATDDYDFYLRAAAQFPCGSHNQPVVEYREHESTLSQQTWTSRHLREVLAVFAKQKPFAQHPEDALAHQAGVRHWCSLYTPYIIYDVFKHLKQKNLREAGIVLYLALRYRPQSIPAFIWDKLSTIPKFRQLSGKMSTQKNGVGHS